MPTRHRSLTLWIVIVAGLTLFARASTVHALTSPPSWPNPPVLIDPLASYDNQPGDRFLAYDHNGVPSIAYANVSGDVYFAQQTGGAGWAFGGVAFPGVASGASLAFDNSELPGISYGEGVGFVHFQKWDPAITAWVDQPLGIPGGDWIETSIAFDVLGNPAIAAYDGLSASTYFVRDNDGDGDLTLEPFEFVALDERRPSLAIDPLNRPVIGLNSDPGTGGSTADVWVKNPILGWGTAGPSFGAFVGSMPANVSVAIDPDDGQPAMAWTDPSTFSLWYAKWDELMDTWDPPVLVDAPGIELGNESLAFDPADGNPAISYSDDAGNVFIAWHDGLGWNLEPPVFNTGPVATNRTSLAFDEFGHGLPAIAVISNDFLGGGELWFVVDPPVATPEPASVIMLLVGLASLLVRRNVYRVR